MKNKINWLVVILIFLGVMLIASAVWLILDKWPSNFPIIPGSIAKHTPTPVADVPSVEFQPLTTKGGYDPQFNHTGQTLYYYTNTGALGQIELGEEVQVRDELISLPLQPSLVWNLQGSYALVESRNSPEGGRSLDILDTSAMSLSRFMDDAWGGAWAPDGKHVTFLQESGLWQARINGKNAILLSDLDDIMFPVYLAWSNLGNRLLLQTLLGTSIYTVVKEQAIQVSWIPWTKDAIWSPDGWMIAYRQDEGDSDSLWVANLDGKNPKQVLKGTFSEVNWLPDNRLVYFTPGKVGGAACWAYDPNSNNHELLADSSVVVWKPVGSIAVSPKGDALAFKAQNHQIWLLKFR
jgi:hypothetical protein